MVTRCTSWAYVAAVLLLTGVSTAPAKYSGGTGEPNDPYQIATPADLIALGETPDDYDKHFLLTADIDLDPNLPGGKVFDKAVIAPDASDTEYVFEGASFTGVFDGMGHTISHLTIEGDRNLGLFGYMAREAEVRNVGVVDVNITGSGSDVGGLVGRNSGRISTCYSTGSVNGFWDVGGLVGYNERGSIAASHSIASVRGWSYVGGLAGTNGLRSSIISSHSAGTVTGEDWVGGLVGSNQGGGGSWGYIGNCYSMGKVTGTGEGVGGLVGINWGYVAQCYSVGLVGGGTNVGGLVGANGSTEGSGIVTDCLWDRQTSGQAMSDGGIGKTTAEMQMAGTFLDAGWDFVGETANGTEDIWWINEGKGYPRLWWEKGNGSGSSTADPNGGIPPLYFFYAIHTHGTDDYLPYTNRLQKQLDIQKADNMIAAIEGISNVLDRYGVLGTWELVEGVAKGIPEYQGPNHIFKQLAARGHEIAAHAHKVDDTYTVVAALQDSCGIVPVTTSGFMTQVSRADVNTVQAAMCEAVGVTVDLGLTVGTANLSPGGNRNLVALACQNQLGVGNDMWADTGNLMFPWRPDYLHGNVCADDPLGGMVFVDHVSIDWLILPDAPGPPDVLDDRHFEQLKAYFDAALRYMEENRPERVACWGFVTHIIEYAVGGAAENPPEASALEALDRFLSYVDSKRAEGRVVYATSGQIANRAFPK